MSDTNEHRKVTSDLMSENPSENRVQSQTKKPRLNPDSVTSAPPAVPAAEEPTEELRDWRTVTVAVAAANKIAAETVAAKALKAVQTAQAELKQALANEDANEDAEEEVRATKAELAKANVNAEAANASLAEVNSAVMSVMNSKNPDRDQNDRVLFLAFCKNLGVTKESLIDHLHIPENADHRSYKRQMELWIETLDSIDNENAAFREEDQESWRNALIRAKRYFHTIDNVIRVQYKKRDSIPEVYANRFKRSEVPGVQEYENMNDASAHDLVTETSQSQSQSHNDNTKYRFWRCDILGRKLEEAQLTELANLIPGSRNHANEWYDVACWAFAIDPFQNEWATGLRVLHGVKDGTNRKSGSGLRHFRANKLCIQGQSVLLDENNPQVLIVPIKTIDECKEWNGEGYNAIVLAKDGAAFEALGAAGSPSKMRSVRYDATLEEVKKAIELLHGCTLALVKSTMADFAEPSEGSINAAEEAMTKEAMTDRDNAKTAFMGRRNNNGSTDIPVPVLQDGIDLVYRGICKISFSDWGVEDDTKNPVPDPLVLVAKASIVWSVMNKMRLRAGAGPPDDDDSSDDSDEVAMLLPPYSADHPLPKPLKIRTLEGTEVECNADDNYDDDASSISSSSVME